MRVVLALMLGYLLGSVPVAYLVAYGVRGEHISNIGDGNPGAANVARSLGKKWGVLVWVGDVTKALLALTLVKMMGIDQIFLLTLVGIAAILGHCYPVFFGFHGGRGIATMGAVVLFIMPRVFPLSLILWFLIQRLNPRSLTVIIQGLVIFLLTIYLVYPRSLFGDLLGSVFLLVATGLVINIRVVSEMKI